MGEKINITVRIAERPYKLAVLREQESFVREAANQINSTIKQYSKTFNYKDHQDLFAMVALQKTTKAIEMEDEKKFREKDLKKKLVELDEILTAHLENWEENSSLK